MPNTGSGRLGEQLTAEYLEEKGYEIVERNFKCRFGEIDIIAQNDRYLAFVDFHSFRTSCSTRQNVRDSLTSRWHVPSATKAIWKTVSWKSVTTVRA